MKRPKGTETSAFELMEELTTTAQNFITRILQRIWQRKSFDKKKMTFLKNLKQIYSKYGREYERVADDQFI